jgi:hypothetical protein
MVSLTRQTKRRRRMRQNNQGRDRKRVEGTASTPAFPVHPEGYDPKAPDAKPAPKRD